jgi:hypothetical protein
MPWITTAPIVAEPTTSNTVDANPTIRETGATCAGPNHALEAAVKISHRPRNLRFGNSLFSRSFVAMSGMTDGQRQKKETNARKMQLTGDTRCAPTSPNSAGPIASRRPWYTGYPLLHPSFPLCKFRTSEGLATPCPEFCRNRIESMGTQRNSSAAHFGADANKYPGQPWNMAR